MIMRDSKYNCRTVVTGASSGIGMETCKLLLSEGRHVVGVDKKPSTIISSYYEHYTCDIANSVSVERLFMREIGSAPIQYLVNCAGIFFYELRAKVEDLSLDEWRAVFETNVLGAVSVTRNCLPLMSGRGDKAILFVSSDQVLHPRKNNSAYAASKGALEVFARACATELKEARVRVNTIEAASVETGFIERLAGGRDTMTELYRRENERMPFGIIQPIDVAHAISFLCSGRARKITGQTLLIDSGLYE